MTSAVRTLFTSAVVVPLAVMAVLASVLTAEVRVQMRAANAIDQVDQVLAQAFGTQKLLLDMETGARAFMLTRDERFLQPYTEASMGIDAAFERLALLTADDPREAEALRTLRLAQAEWRADIAQRIAVVRAGQPLPPHDALVAELVVRKVMMDRMRESVDTIVAGEEVERATRERDVTRATTATMVSAAAMLLLVAAVLFFVTRRNLVAITDRFSEALERQRAAREQAEEALRARESFLHMASHELKTPVTSLRLQVESILRQIARASASGGAPRIERIEQKAQAALRQLTRLQELIASLLDVERLAKSGPDLLVTDVDAVLVARDALARLESDVRDSGCSLTIDVPRHAVVRADPMRLDQVVTNLVTNALKYGRGRPVTLTIRRGAARTTITVRDEGIGISAGDQARIFERFERAVSGDHFHGFGLGLWIVKNLVDGMGGTIRVESAEGKGATFVVELSNGDAPELDYTGEHSRARIPLSR